LYSENTGLPVESFTEDDVNEKTEEVHHHIFRAYPTVPSPFYSNAL